ncbi:MAG: putative C-S lyase, partial [Bacteroidales bacterium]|nr:putative C-S lyase [Bacteroidales bacterium]
VYGYTVRKDEFPESITSWMKRRHTWEVDKEWISFSPGVVPALNMCILAYSDPGDKVLIQPPVYFPFFRAIRDHKRELTENELVYQNGTYTIDFEDFELKARDAKIFILCHPHNPVGRLWNREELSRMLEICIKYKVLILSDEIHSDLILCDEKHIPLLSLPGADSITISMYAPSKTFNLAGLSTSYLIIPDRELKKTYDKMLDNLHIGLGNIFGFEAMQAAYRDGEPWLGQLIEYLRDNVDFLIDFMKENIPRVKVIRPQATYLVWLDFRELGMKRDALREFVVQKAGLGLNDGPSFGAGGEGFQRINVAVPRSVLREALEKLKSAILDSF